MSAWRHTWVRALAAGLAAGALYALVELVFDCRERSSEACFWAREYFLITLLLSLALVGGAASALVFALLRFRRRRQTARDPGTGSPPGP